MWYWTKMLFFILAGAIGVWLLYELVTFPAISRLRTENPTTTSMIEYRISEAKADGREPRKYMIWVPIEQISPNLQRAVLAGEDSRFFEHNGFDWDAIQQAWDEAVKEGEKEAREECEAEAKASNTSKKDCAPSEDDWIPPMPSFKRGASTISQLDLAAAIEKSAKTGRESNASGWPAGMVGSAMRSAGTSLGRKPSPGVTVPRQ